MEAASVAVNAMLALVDVVEPEGADVSEVSGAVVSSAAGGVLVGACVTGKRRWRSPS